MTAGKYVLAEPGTVGKTPGPPLCLMDLALNVTLELLNAYGGCAMNSDDQQ